MKKFLYIDIDYVLSLRSESKLKQTFWGLLYPFNKKAVKILNYILKETNADMIVSSDWRLTFSLEELQKIFIDFAGIEKYPIDVTPYISGGTLQNLEEYRAKEILKHVNEHQPDSWVAIDDLDLRSWISEEHFVYLPMSNEGIKQSGKANKIIKNLNIITL
jgi:hypothetical protein